MANNTTNVAAANGPYVAPPSEVVKERERIYILSYRHQNQVKTKNFNFRGPLKDAIERGRVHCKSMGYIFVLVRPFVIDLEHQEDLKNNSPDQFVEGY